MSKSANPVRVGVFVVCGALIAVIAVMVFGASAFFTRTETVVCYFHDSVNGLDVGAPVKYKGVKIGKVEEIRIHISRKDMRNTRIEVIMSVDLDAVKRKVSLSSGAPGDTEFIRQVEEGLRAQLAFQSIVTGMLYVELDYFAAPGEPYKLYGKHGIHEIPVSPSGLSDLAKKVESMMVEVSEIDFKGISANLNTLLVNVNAKVEALDTVQINEKVLAALDNVNTLAGDPELAKAAENMNLLLQESRGFVASTGATVNAVGVDARAAISKLNGILSNLDAVMAPTSPFRYEFSLLMKNLSDTSLSIKALADYIERNPSSIITGKPVKSKESE